jgi:Tfp pilus assembly ATPase PilU
MLIINPLASAQALLALYRHGIISREQALAYSVDAAELKEMLGKSH